MFLDTVSRSEEIADQPNFYFHAINFFVVSIVIDVLAVPNVLTRRCSSDIDDTIGAKWTNIDPAVAVCGHHPDKVVLTLTMQSKFQLELTLAQSLPLGALYLATGRAVPARVAKPPQVDVSWKIHLA